MLILLFAVCGFAANLSGRFFDPLVTEIARDYAVPVSTAALLSSAFTLPFSLGQPFLGPAGDAFGKTVVFKTCMWLVAAGLVLAALAASLGALFASRVVTGLAAGGTIPLALAMLGDFVPAAERQVAIARFSAGAIAGQLVGLTAAGTLAEAVGWRPALWLPAVVAVAAAAAAMVLLPKPPRAPRPPLSLSDTVARYRAVFRNPAAAVCYATVFAEGVAVYGPIPFVAELLEHRGAGGPREAGFVIAGFGIGCIILSVIVPVVLRVLGTSNMMRVGGVLAALGLCVLGIEAAWPVYTAGFVVTGFGFFLIHNSLQGRVTELAPAARGSAISLHYFFFFIGQAVGPVLFGFVSADLGLRAAIAMSALLIVATGALGAYFLARTAPQPV